MHSFERRKLEVFFAVLTAGFGVWLLFPSVAMGSPGLADVRGIMSEAKWGWLFLTVGLAHCVWLAVNGARWWSPLVRFWAAYAAGGIYAVWCVNIAAYDPSSTGVFTYGMLGAGSWACCVFAWHDALTAMRVHRAIATHS